MTLEVFQGMGYYLDLLERLDENVLYLFYREDRTCSCTLERLIYIHTNDISEDLKRFLYEVADCSEFLTVSEENKKDFIKRAKKVFNTFPELARPKTLRELQELLPKLDFDLPHTTEELDDFDNYLLENDILTAIKTYFSDYFVPDDRK